jgi:hypothetical protein
MEFIWGLFEKRFSDLRLDERVALSLIILLCLCLVVYAISMVVHLARTSDGRVSQKIPKKALRKGIGQAGGIDDYEPRASHTD